MEQQSQKQELVEELKEEIKEPPPAEAIDEYQDNFGDNLSNEGSELVYSSQQAAEPDLFEAGAATKTKKVKKKGKKKKKRKSSVLSLSMLSARSRELNLEKIEEDPEMEDAGHEQDVQPPFEKTEELQRMPTVKEQADSYELSRSLLRKQQKQEYGLEEDEEEMGFQNPFGTGRVDEQPIPADKFRSREQSMLADESPEGS